MQPLPATERVSGSGPSLKFPIIVPASVMAADAPVYALACAVVDFVNHALGTCLYTRDELPIEAMLAFHVDYYVAQVNNGGHGQFAYNSGWEDFILKDIQHGLKAIEVAAAVATFDSFVAFSRVEAGRFGDVVKRSGFGQEDSFVGQLDQRFYAGLGDQIQLALRNWIAALPMLEVVRDERYRDAMEQLGERNTARASRLAERESAALKSQQADPIHQALAHICRLTPGNFGFIKWLNARSMKGGGTAFLIDTSQGIATIHIFPERVGFNLGNETQPRSKIDTIVIHEFLQRSGLPGLPEDMIGGR